MELLGQSHLERTVERFRLAGVRVPAGYPPAHLDPSSEWFRGFLAELEVVELLMKQFPPEQIEMKMPSEGDTDIVVCSKPCYLLQVKDMAISLVRNADETQVPLEDVTAAAIRQTNADIESKNPAGSFFTRIEIHRDSKGSLAFTGDISEVTYAGRVRLWLVEVDPGVIEESMKLKLERCIGKAYLQLRGHDKGVLVPVLNMRRYPHDQAFAFKHVKRILKENPRWKKLGGVLMVTNDFSKEAGPFGFHSPRIRFIGIENPNAPAVRRLVPQSFNPIHDDEVVHEERRAIIHIEPLETPFSISEGKILIDSTVFGEVPRNYSYPTAIRVFGSRMTSESSK